MKKYQIAILASGSGSNAEEIVKYFQSHSSIEIALILSNNPSAFVLQRAEKLSIPHSTFSRTEFKETTNVVALLKERQVTHIVLAGFLWLIPDYLIKAFPNRIINIHPALLPKYGGKGMFGMKVHEAVKNAGDEQTGITIHLVNEHYDEGEILFQASCAIDKNSEAHDIANCVHTLEHFHYPRVIEKWVLNNDQISA